MLKLFINTPEYYPMTSQYLSTLVAGMKPIDSLFMGRLIISHLEKPILELCEAENPDKYNISKPILEIDYLH